MADHIQITLPAREEFARTLRMTAAALASRTGMSLDDVEDVRIAVEEAYLFAIGRVEPGSAVTYDFAVDDGQLSLEVGPLPSDREGSSDGHEAGYARFILESVCDSYELEEQGAVCRLRISKKAAR